MIGLNLLFIATNPRIERCIFRARRTGSGRYRMASFKSYDAWHWQVYRQALVDVVNPSDTRDGENK